MMLEYAIVGGIAHFYRSMAEHVNNCSELGNVAHDTCLSLRCFQTTHNHIPYQPHESAFSHQFTAPRLSNKMPPLSSSPLTTFLAVVLCAVAGYYVGKTSGLRAAERIHDLKGRDPALDDNFAASGMDRSTSTNAKDRKGKGKAKAEDEEEEWESEDEEGDDEEDDDGGVNIKKFENSHEACKMVGTSVPTHLGTGR